MPKTPRQPAVLATSASDVEAAFYEALQNAHLDRLMACWAEDEEIVCTLPGGPRLVGGVAIRLAFERMFSLSAIRAWPQHMHTIDSMTASVHSVIERVEIMLPEGPRQNWVAATNVYFKTVHGWRMVMHHASPGAAQPPEVKEPGKRLLH
ncbi:MAG: nuclear transport factor 2 family protein [Burkholderiaceae bacterium]|nr:nuclear transport factor 2 family protein [Burkholderiaceae bacterium]